MNSLSVPPAARRRAYAQLVTQVPGAAGEQRWQLLMAAHVLGQHDPRLHLDSHLRMLRQALELKQRILQQLEAAV